MEADEDFEKNREKFSKKFGVNELITQIEDNSGRNSVDFPAYMYKIGKYVSNEQAEIRQIQEYMSTSLYDICFRERISKPSLQRDFQESAPTCYRKKVAIFRQIIDVNSSIQRNSGS